MQEIKGKVSVVIPAYNAEEYITETLTSVKLQSYTDWEIIVINDGSTDNTANLVLKESCSKTRLINQVNSGVSTARNKGLAEATGEYIVFFDADDLMTSDFLEIRVDCMNENPELGFAGGLIESFPVKSALIKAAAKDPESEILFFDARYATVPSNYIIRRKLLIDSGIKFNTNLSSTADRFFILQLTKYVKGTGIESEKGKLLYRVSSKSMSHNISPALITDNEKFYYQLSKTGMLPLKKRASFKSLYFFSLSLGFIKIKKIDFFLKYIVLSFFSSPVKFIKLAGKKIFT